MIPVPGRHSSRVPFPSNISSAMNTFDPSEFLTRTPEFRINVVEFLTIKDVLVLDVSVSSRIVRRAMRNPDEQKITHYQDTDPLFKNMVWKHLYVANGPHHIDFFIDRNISFSRVSFGITHRGLKLKLSEDLKSCISIMLNFTAKNLIQLDFSSCSSLLTGAMLEEALRSVRIPSTDIKLETLNLALCSRITDDALIALLRVSIERFN